MPLTFALLGLAALAAWGAAAASVPWREWPWRVLLTASALAAIGEGFMDWRGGMVAGALCGAVLGYQGTADRRAQAAWGVAAILLAAALATHRVPGFEPYLVAERIQLSPVSAQMTIEANYDKGFAGVLLLATFCIRARSVAEWLRAVGVGLLAGAVTAAVVIGLAVAVGPIRYDPKLPAIAAAWMAVNLVLTCIFEEALFRGVIQHRLSSLVVGRPRWNWLPLSAASVLFGLAHAGGGPVLIAVAAIAGLGYGIAYAMTGRVEAAIVAHFTLNSIHFLGFTYPYAVR